MLQSTSLNQWSTPWVLSITFTNELLRYLTKTWEKLVKSLYQKKKWRKINSKCTIWRQYCSFLKHFEGRRSSQSKVVVSYESIDLRFLTIFAFFGKIFNTSSVLSTISSLFPLERKSMRISENVELASYYLNYDTSWAS